MGDHGSTRGSAKSTVAQATSLRHVGLPTDRRAAALAVVIHPNGRSAHSAVTHRGRHRSEDQATTSAESDWRSRCWAR